MWTRVGTFPVGLVCRKWWRMKKNSSATVSMQNRQAVVFLLMLSGHLILIELSWWIRLSMMLIMRVFIQTGWMKSHVPVLAKSMTWVFPVVQKLWTIIFQVIIRAKRVFVKGMIMKNITSWPSWIFRQRNGWKLVWRGII